MSTKDYADGVNSANNAQNGFNEKQAKATEEIGKRVTHKIDEHGKIIETIIDDLSEQSKDRLFGLKNEIKDISALDSTEKEVLLSLLFTLSNVYGQTNLQQQNYLNTIRRYLGMSGYGSNIVLKSVENIESKEDTECLFNTVNEFLFLKDGSFQYLEDDQLIDFLDSFNLNNRRKKIIQNSINEIYKLYGIEGLADRYYVYSDDNNTASEGNKKFLEKAERYFLKYEFDKALPIIDSLIEENVGRAFYLKSELSAVFDTVTSNNNNADEFIKVGAELSDPLCSVSYAKKSDDFQERTKIIDQYAPILEKWAAEDDVLAKFELSSLYEEGYGVKKDRDKSLKLLRESSDCGYWKAQSKLAYYLAEQGDKDEAKKLWENLLIQFTYPPAVINLMLISYPDNFMDGGNKRFYESTMKSNDSATKRRMQALEKLAESGYAPALNERAFLKFLSIGDSLFGEIGAGKMLSSVSLTCYIVSSVAKKIIPKEEQLDYKKKAIISDLSISANLGFLPAKKNLELFNAMVRSRQWSHCSFLI